MARVPLPSFCPACGAPVGPIRSAAGEGQCSGCSRRLYATSRPAAGVLIERGGRVLLVRRGAEPAAGKWDIPGGFLHEGEWPEQGARREIQEELSLALGRLRPAAVGINALAEGAVLDLIYEASDFAGEPLAGSDAAEWAWFDPDALPQDLAFDATADILRRWVAARRSGSMRLLGGERIEADAMEEIAAVAAPWSGLPSGWSVECGEWEIHDGALCARVEGERPAVLWLDEEIEGDHMIRFTAWTVAPHANDLNCFWEGSGRILTSEPASNACTIGGVGGWWDNLTGIERHPEGGIRAVTCLAPIEVGRAYEIAGGRQGKTDFLFVDGRLSAQLDDPGSARRPRSRVALSTWNSHVHYSRAAAFRLLPAR